MYWDIIYITGLVLLRVFSWVCTAPLGYFCFQTSHLKLISTVFPSRNACTVCSVRCWIYENSKRHSLLINIYTAVCRKLQIIGQCVRASSPWELKALFPTTFWALYDRGDILILPPQVQRTSCRNLLFGGATNQKKVNLKEGGRMLNCLLQSVNELKAQFEINSDYFWLWSREDYTASYWKLVWG